MVNRTTQIVALTAASILMASSAACSSDPSIQDAQMDDVAAKISSGYVLLWHIRTEDCLSCSLPDYSVRRLQAWNGEQFQLVVVHIGRETQESIPSGFLRQRRITPTSIITMSAREHRVHFPAIQQLPALVLLKDATVLWSSGDSVQAEEREVSLHDRIDALISPEPE